MTNLKNTLIRTAGVAALALLATSSIASAATITVQDVTVQGTQIVAAPFSLLALGSTGSPGQHGTVTNTSFAVSNSSITNVGFNTGSNTAAGEYYGTNETPYASPFGGNSNNNFLVAGAEGSNPGIVTITYATAQTSLNLLWGTIDFTPTTQNEVIINTTGGTVTVTGVDLHNLVSSLQNGQDDAYVTISNLPGTFTSVTFEDASDTNAFEFVPGAVPTAVPEPLTLSLFGAGLAGAAMIRRRKGKKA